MSEMVERVARAMAARCRRSHDWPFWMDEARAAIEACFQWPRHEASMHITHNDHKSYYQTVEEAIADESHGYHPRDWISEEQKQKAIATNECWSLQWYPDTPIGFCNLSAAELPALLDAALSEGEG
jgi:hypothetical protein